MSDALHMVQLRINTRLLFRERRALSAPREGFDAGYSIHCLLAELFGEYAPKPFSLESSERGNLMICGYTTVPANVLLEQAKLFASPDLYNSLDKDNLISKEIPNVFRPGMRLGFKVRICPVTRYTKSEKVEGENGKVKKIILEGDVFKTLHKKAEKGLCASPSSREKVYLNWLEQLIENTGGAKTESLSLRSLSSEKLLRRTHGDTRINKPIQRPSCVVEGVLNVTDKEKFFRVLKHGLGRHKSFGFGMLLIRPAGNSPC